MNARNIFSELSSEIEERTRTGGLAGGGLGDGGNGGGLSSCIAEGIQN
jgi:hypothetical protein